MGPKAVLLVVARNPRDRGKKQIASRRVESKLSLGPPVVPFLPFFLVGRVLLLK